MSDLKDLFQTALVEPGPDRLDVDAAIRRGRRRRATKTLAVVASTSLVVAAALALVISALPRTTEQVLGSPPPSSSVTAAPVLPAGQSLVASPAELVGIWGPTELYGRSILEILAPAIQGASDPVMASVTFSQAADGAWVWQSRAAGNSVNGTYAVGGGRFRAKEVYRSQVYYEVDPALLEADTLNIRALTDADEARFVRDATSGLDLVLLQDGKVIARYAGPGGQGQARAYLQDSPELALGPHERTEPVGDVDALLGNWRPVEVGGHDLNTVNGRRDLWFSQKEDGSYVWSGWDGCNTWNGTYEVRAETFRASGGGSTYAACSEVNVPAAATILAVTAADQALLLLDDRPDRDRVLLLMRDDRMLARLAWVPYSRPSVR